MISSGSSPFNQPSPDLAAPVAAAAVLPATLVAALAAFPAAPVAAPATFLIPSPMPPRLARPSLVCLRQNSRVH